MATPRHEIPPAYRGMSLDELVRRQIARFKDIEPDWDAFADSQTDGGRRAQLRFIGAGGSGKDDPNAIPAGHFTLSMLIVPPGQGGNAHTHEIEEAFFVLEGTLTVFFEDEAGRRVEAELGPREVVSCPPGIPHGFVNRGDQDVHMQVILGSGRPGPVGFVDEAIYKEEVERLTARGRL